MDESPTSQHRATDETLRAIFNAIVDYHNSMIQTRFTIAGLYLAATGFLANSWFSDSQHSLSLLLIPLGGVWFGVLCWLLELRTRHLVDNFGKEGREIERQLGMERGFFAITKEQHYPLKLPFWGPETSPKWGHTTSLDLLYASTIIFWWLALIWQILEFSLNKT